MRKNKLKKKNKTNIFFGRNIEDRKKRILIKLQIANKALDF